VDGANNHDLINIRWSMLVACLVVTDKAIDQAHKGRVSARLVLPPLMYAAL
jgi:hypothetical protein